MIRPAKERERLIGLVLYYTVFILILALSISFTVLMFVQSEKIAHRTEDSAANIQKLEHDLLPENIGEINEQYLLRALKSSGGAFSGNRLNQVLSNLWNYRLYITVGSGEEMLLTAENASLASVATGETVVVTLRESMDYTYLPKSVALLGRLFSDDISDTIESYVSAPDDVDGEYTEDIQTDAEGRVTILSTLSYEFVYEEGKTYDFEIMILMQDRLSTEQRTLLVHSGTSPLYSAIRLG